MSPATAVAKESQSGTPKQKWNINVALANMGNLCKKYIQHVFSIVIDHITPNRPQGVAGFSVVFGLWLIFLLVLWATAPVSYIPSPMAVFKSIPTLFTDDGLGVELYTSMMLNIHAMLLMTGLTMFIAY